MTSSPFRLSVPEVASRPPRDLGQPELAGLLAVADFLIPASGELPSASAAPGFEAALARALATRADSFEEIVAAAERLGALAPERLGPAVRRLAAEDPRLFSTLSSVLAGAYLILPEIRRAIGYPGQGGKHAQFDQAAEELMDGILDPVIERGPVYREV